jgi:hypothetical protein
MPALWGKPRRLFPIDFLGFATIFEAKMVEIVKKILGFLGLNICVAQKTNSMEKFFVRI